jgi:DNA transposition AAA+ family ATPase
MNNVTEIDTAKLRRQAETALAEGMSQTELARLAGTSASTLGRWLKDSYEGDNEKVARQVEGALHALADRQAQTAALPAAPAYIPTPTSERIVSALRYAHVASDVVVIYGGAGVGKTQSLQHYAKGAPNVYIATATPASAGVVPALEEVADALGVAIASGAARLHRAIVKRLVGTYGLLIIDEAQHLSVAALDQMRSIHDATNCGLALVGNSAVYTTMTGGNRAPYLDRLFSRIGKRVRVNAAGHKDTDAIIEAWGIQANDCKKLLRDIASKPGGLRILTKTLRLASMYAAGDKRAVCCPDIRAAWRELTSVELQVAGGAS